MVLPPLWSWEMVSFMVDQFWRTVSMVFSGRVNISFTHAYTIKKSSSEIVFNSPLGYLSGPDVLSGFRQCPMNFVISWQVSVPCNLPCVPLDVLWTSILSLVISSNAAIVPLLCLKSVKYQYPYKKAITSCLLFSAVSCGILVQVFLAHPNSSSQTRDAVLVHEHILLTRHIWGSTTMAAGTGERAEPQ